MSDWTDEQDTQEDPGRRKRSGAKRAVLGGIAGVALLVGPIALANSIIPDGEDSDVSTDQAAPTSLVALRAAQGNAQTDSAQMQSLQARYTTTTSTTAPPTTTTTTAPPTTTTTTAPPTTTTTEAPPMTTPPAPPSSGELGDPNFDGSWDALAQCESSGNWSINTGNGYYGGLQFALATWQGLGGTGLPSEHSREVQIAMGKKLWESSGWGAWPGCTSKLGWR